MTDREPDRASIDRVRAFNRAVTARIGALEDEYLGSARSLGASRVLWEVRDDGVDVREIRVRLEASAADSRVRTARPTEAGRAERAELDRRSDELAATLLAPLSPRQRER